jgi:hypothetical protein
MVEWFVLRPHISKVLALILNLKGAVLRFFMGLLKHFQENYGAVPSVGQLLLRHPSQFIIHNHPPIS